MTALRFRVDVAVTGDGAVTVEILIYVTMIIPLSIIIISLILLYRAVKKQEKRIAKYSFVGAKVAPPSGISLWMNQIKMSLSRESSSGANNSANQHYHTRTTPGTMRSNNMQSQSRAVMHRAILYSLAWFLSWGMAIVVFFIPTLPLPLWYINSIFLPVPGFFNLCIYVYPKVICARKARRGEKKLSWCQAISKVIWSRGKETNRKRNRRRRKTRRNHKASNLTGGDHGTSTCSRNRPLRTTRNSNACARDMKSTTEDDDNNKQTHRREPQEEEEKSEIQPHPAVHTLVPARHKNAVSGTYYAPNHVTHPNTDTHLVDDLIEHVEKDGEGNDDTLEANMDNLEGLDDKSIVDKKDASSESDDAATITAEDVRTGS